MKDQDKKALIKLIERIYPHDLGPFLDGTLTPDNRPIFDDYTLKLRRIAENHSISEAEQTAVAAWINEHPEGRQVYEDMRKKETIPYVIEGYTDNRRKLFKFLGTLARAIYPKG